MKSSFKECHTKSYDLNIKKEGDILNTNTCVKLHEN